MRSIFVAGAAVALVLFFLLGRAAGHDADPAWLMALVAPLVGDATPLAIAFTASCYAYVLAPLCIVLLVAAWRVPAWRWRAVLLVVALLLAWQGADLFQHLFARPRRLDWVWKHETAFSYPSSHAAIATAVYLTLAVLIARSALRYKAAACTALVLLWAGILWSRLALGAHYPTDLLGGILWGTAVVLALAAAAPINVFEPLAGRR